MYKSHYCFLLPIQGYQCRAQQFDQKGQGSRLKPEIPEVSLFQVKQNIKGIVNLLPQPVVPIVPVFDLCQIHIIVYPAGKHAFQLILGITADRGKIWTDGNVFQIIQPAEKGNLVSP